MRIIKTKEIAPISIGRHDDNFQYFQDRTKIHNNQRIPPFAVYINEKDWDSFFWHGIHIYNEIKTEAQGIFLGKYYKDKYGEFIITYQYEAGEGDSTAVYVEMSAACLARISDKCQDNGLNMTIWAHTHPGLGVFYSGTDNSCLKTNFYKPYQIGIVVDILSKQIKGFQTINSKIVEFNDYFIVNLKSNKIYKPFKEMEAVNMSKKISIEKKQSAENSGFLSNQNIINLNQTISDLSSRISEIRSKIGQTNLLNEEVKNLRALLDVMIIKVNELYLVQKKVLEDKIEKEKDTISIPLSNILLIINSILLAIILFLIW